MQSYKCVYYCFPVRIGISPVKDITKVNLQFWFENNSKTLPKAYQSFILKIIKQQTANGRELISTTPVHAYTAPLHIILEQIES